jgi:hypothetical protein
LIEQPVEISTSRSRSKYYAGQRFGRLILLEREGYFLHRGGSRSTAWRCRCDCGNELVVQSGRLSGGNTTSCGCYFLNRRRELGHNSALNSLYSIYKYRGNKRAGSFELSLDDFAQLTSSRCYYCGVEPFQIYTARAKVLEPQIYVYSGLDRLNPKLNYTLANVVPCCGRCNEAKNDLTEQEFHDWIERVYLNYVKCIEVKNL